MPGQTTSKISNITFPYFINMNLLFVALGLEPETTPLVGGFGALGLPNIGLHGGDAAKCSGDRG